jgi:hypothetical protein
MADNYGNGEDELEQDRNDDERPIKLRCNEEMRAHLEFMTRRYMAECRDWQRRGKNLSQLASELELSEKCLHELMEPGT